MALLAFAPGYLVPMLANVFSIYVLTRILSPADYGSYAFVMSIMQLGQTGLLDWAGLGAKRFFERSVQNGKLPSMCTTIYLGLGVSALVVFAACGVGLGIFDVSAEMSHLLWIGATVIIARALSTVSKSLELAAMSRRRYMLMECGESLVGVALGLWLCWSLKLGASGLLYGLLSGSLLVVASDAKRIIHRLRGGTIDLDLQKEVLAFSLPVSLGFFVEFVMSSADRMLIEFFRGASELGIYAVAYNIAERAVNAVFLALAIGSYPLMVRALERGGPDAAKRQAKQNVEVLMAIAIPALGGFIMASGQIAGVLAGPAYAARVAELLPLAGVAVFTFSLRVHYFSYSQQLTNKTWTLLVASGPAALINVALLAVLLPSIGLMGAVWARLAAYLVALGITLWLCQRQLPLPFPVSGVVKASLATLAMCGVMYMLPFRGNVLGLTAMIVTGAAFYGALALAFDFGGLRSMLRQRRLHPATT
jgi:O-antigen/teichoic acid export membrane protein